MNNPAAGFLTGGAFQRPQGQSYIEFDPKTNTYTQVNPGSPVNLPFGNNQGSRVKLDPANLGLTHVAFSGAPGTINPTRAQNDPVGTLAQVTRGQFALKEQQFDPLIDELISFVNNKDLPQQRGTQAGNVATTAFDATRGVEERNAGRLGLDFSAVKPQVDKTFLADRALTQVGAVNTARFETKDLQDTLGLSVLSSGRGVQSNALNSLASAAAGAQNTENQRVAKAQQKKQADAAQTQSFISTGISLAGLGIAAGLF